MNSTTSYPFLCSLLLLGMLVATTHPSGSSDTTSRCERVFGPLAQELRGRPQTALLVAALGTLDRQETSPSTTLAHQQPLSLHAQLLRELVMQLGTQLPVDSSCQQGLFKLALTPSALERLVPLFTLTNGFDPRRFREILLNNDQEPPDSCVRLLEPLSCMGLAPTEADFNHAPEHAAELATPSRAKAFKSFLLGKYTEPGHYALSKLPDEIRPWVKWIGRVALDYSSLLPPQASLGVDAREEATTDFQRCFEIVRKHALTCPPEDPRIAFQAQLFVASCGQRLKHLPCLPQGASHAFQACAEKLRRYQFNNPGLQELITIITDPTVLMDRSLASYLVLKTDGLTASRFVAGILRCDPDLNFLRALNYFHPWNRACCPKDGAPPSVPLMAACKVLYRPDRHRARFEALLKDDPSAPDTFFRQIACPDAPFLNELRSAYQRGMNDDEFRVWLAPYVLLAFPLLREATTEAMQKFITQAAQKKPHKLVVAKTTERVDSPRVAKALETLHNAHANLLFSALWRVKDDAWEKGPLNLPHGQTNWRKLENVMRALAKKFKDEPDADHRTVSSYIAAIDAPTLRAFSSDAPGFCLHTDGFNPHLFVQHAVAGERICLELLDRYAFFDWQNTLAEEPDGRILAANLMLDSADLEKLERSLIRCTTSSEITEQKSTAAPSKSSAPPHSITEEDNRYFTKTALLSALEGPDPYVPPDLLPTNIRVLVRQFLAQHGSAATQAGGAAESSLHDEAQQGDPTNTTQLISALAVRVMKDFPELFAVYEELKTAGALTPTPAEQAELKSTRAAAAAIDWDDDKKAASAHSRNRETASKKKKSCPPKLLQEKPPAKTRALSPTPKPVRAVPPTPVSTLALPAEQPPTPACAAPDTVIIPEEQDMPVEQAAWTPVEKKSARPAQPPRAATPARMRPLPTARQSSSAPQTPPLVRHVPRRELTSPASPSRCLQPSPLPVLPQTAVTPPTTAQPEQPSRSWVDLLKPAHQAARGPETSPETRPQEPAQPPAVLERELPTAQHVCVRIPETAPLIDGKPRRFGMLPTKEELFTAIWNTQQSWHARQNRARTIVRENPALINCVDACHGAPVLQHALMTNMSGLVHDLLQYRTQIDPCIRNRYGATALHVAAQFSKNSSVQHVLTHLGHP